MNSRITLGLAGLFLVGAIIAGYWGLTLSSQTAPEPVGQPGIITPAPTAQTPAPVDDPTRQPVVVLLHDVPPLVPISAADVTLEKLRTVPAGSLSRLDQAIGRTVAHHAATPPPVGGWGRPRGQASGRWVQA